MAVVHLPRSLVTLFPATPRRVDVDAATVDAVIGELDRRWPGMRDRLCEPGPRIREHVNVFVDGDRAELATRVAPASVVHVIPAVSGGSAVPAGPAVTGAAGACPGPALVRQRYRAPRFAPPG